MHPAGLRRDNETIREPRGTNWGLVGSLWNKKRTDFLLACSSCHGLEKESKTQSFKRERVGVCERQRKRQRQRETKRQRHRNKGRDRDTETETEKDTDTKRGRVRQTERETKTKRQ